MTAAARSQSRQRSRTQRTIYDCHRMVDGPCNNRWICPTCSPRIAEHRARQIDSALEQHRAMGGGVVMLTVTVEHTRTDPLDLVWSRLSATNIMWKSQTISDQLRENVFARIVGTHVIWSREGGWHPHHHQLMFTMTPWGEPECGDFIRRIGDWFKRRPGKTGPRQAVPSGTPLHVPSRPGVDWGVSVDARTRDGNAGHYLASPVDHCPEALARMNADAAARQTWTPLQLVHEAELTGDRAFRRLATEAAAVCRGHQPIRWSPGLEAWFNVKGAA